MKPHSLVTTRGIPAQPPINAEWVARHGVYPKGTVLPETAVLHCPRRKISDFPKGFIPARYYENNLEYNQFLPSCCRHPENHYIEGYKSHPREPRADRYEIICTADHYRMDKDPKSPTYGQMIGPFEARHRVFCVGMGDERPEWR